MKIYFAMRQQKQWDKEAGKWSDEVEYIPRRAHSGPYAGYSSPGKARQYNGSRENSYVVEVETDDFLPLESSLDEQIHHAEAMMLRWGDRLAALEKTAKE